MLNGRSPGSCVSLFDIACNTALPITPANSFMGVQPAVRPNGRRIASR